MTEECTIRNLPKHLNSFLDEMLKINNISEAGDYFINKINEDLTNERLSRYLNITEGYGDVAFSKMVLLNKPLDVEYLCKLYNEVREELIGENDKYFISILEANATTTEWDTFTPEAFEALKSSVENPVCCIISGDLFSEAMLDNKWISNPFEEDPYLDPMSKVSEVMKGNLGTLKGIPIISDCNRMPNEKALPENTLYILGADCGELKSTKLDKNDIVKFSQGEQVEGWSLDCYYSINVDPTKVVKGVLK